MTADKRSRLVAMLANAKTRYNAARSTGDTDGALYARAEIAKIRAALGMA